MFASGVHGPYFCERIYIYARASSQNTRCVHETSGNVGASLAISNATP